VLDRRAGSADRIPASQAAGARLNPGRVALDCPVGVRKQLSAGPAIVLTLAFLAVNAFGLVRSDGPKSGTDTPRFITGAVPRGEAATHPHPFGQYLPPSTEHSPPKVVAYLGYVWLIALSRTLFGRAESVLVFQWLFGWVATLLLYRVMLERTTRMLAAIGAGLFIALPDIWLWNQYVLTESIYISFVGIAVFALHRLLQRPSGWRLLFAVLALCALALIRPSGWIVLALTLPVLWFQFLGATKRSIAVAIIGGAVVLYAVARPVRQEVLREQVGGYLIGGYVIGGYGPLYHQMPPPRFEADGTMASYVRYVWEEPLPSIELFASRFLWGVGQVRPYYSVGHNVGIIVILWPLTVLAASTARRVARDPLSRVLWIVCLAHVAANVFVIVDWTGRYYDHMLPALIVLGVDGIYAVRRDRLFTRVASPRALDVSLPPNP